MTSQQQKLMMFKRRQHLLRQCVRCTNGISCFYNQRAQRADLDYKASNCTHHLEAYGLFVSA
ncbi:hypothetical protein PF003_g34707 [Phytophthora fragariae]|nr:hypothetical protein PF003_g34707 [Phytophthora fragariae]